MVKPINDDPLPEGAHNLPWDSIDPEDTLGKYAGESAQQSATPDVGWAYPPTETPPSARVEYLFDDANTKPPTPKEEKVETLDKSALKPSPCTQAESPDFIGREGLGEGSSLATEVQAPSPQLSSRVQGEGETEVSRAPAQPAAAWGSSPQIASAPTQDPEPSEPIPQTAVLERIQNRPLVSADISAVAESPKPSPQKFPDRFNFAQDFPNDPDPRISPSPGTPGEGRGGGPPNDVGSASTGANPAAQSNQPPSPVDADHPPLATRRQIKIQKKPLSTPVEIKPTPIKSALDPHQPTPATQSQSTPHVLPDGGGWTITLLCVGLALIAACVIIPQADANRRLAYDGKQLALDLDQIQKQVAVNKDFLQKIQSDPQLAERLAQRQMKLIRQGETVLDIQPAPDPFSTLTSNEPHSQDAQRMSPFSITTIPPAPPLPYQPTGGQFANLCRQPQTRLYIMGASLFMVAAGLVLGGPVTRASRP